MLIPVETLNLKANWIQIRRIDCGTCKAPYRVLASGLCVGISRPRPVGFANKEAMDVEARRNFQSQLDAIGNKPRMGSTACPTCQNHPSWMLAGFKQDQMGLVAGVTAAIGLIPSFALTYQMKSWQLFGESIHPMMIGIVASALVGMAVGWAMPLLRKPPAAPTACAMDEKAWRAFSEECQANNADAATAWRARLKEPPSEIPVVILKEFTEPAT